MTRATLELARRALDPRKLALPPRPIVESIEVEEMVDWEGDEGLRVQVIIGEDTRDEELTGKFGIALRFAIREALAAEGIEQFPYTYLAKPSDLIAEGEVEDVDSSGEDMQSMHQDLLDQARALLHLDPTRPKQANLRRAVSAAYYLPKVLFGLPARMAILGQPIALPMGWQRASLRLANRNTMCEKSRSS